jgi:retron-type reverse transcriptase
MYDALCSWENLLHAYRRASKGKRGTATVAAFEHRLGDELAALRDDLVTGRYRPSGYTSFHIHEPKRRLISAAAFRDRVVHHALCLQIEPLFERAFTRDSYANRVGQGTHRALSRAQHLARQHPLVLQLDVRQFFPSLDHGVLRGLLARKVSDARVLGLIELILASGDGIHGEAHDMTFFDGDDLLAILRPRGLPIGNLTSQFWANVYMNPIDHFISRELRCDAYVRYVDDMLLFGDDRRSLADARERLVGRLARMRLTIHPGAHVRPVAEGFPFLGFVVYPGGCRLKRRKGVHFARRLRRAIAGHARGRCTTRDVSAMVRSWVNHVRQARTHGLRRAVLAQCRLRPLQPSMAATWAGA